MSADNVIGWVRNHRERILQILSIEDGQLLAPSELSLPAPLLRPILRAPRSAERACHHGSNPPQDRAAGYRGLADYASTDALQASADGTRADRLLDELQNVCHLLQAGDDGVAPVQV